MKTGQVLTAGALLLLLAPSLFAEDVSVKDVAETTNSETTTAEALVVPAAISQAIDGGRLVTLTLPGALLDTADTCREDRCQGLLLLAKSEDDRTLYYYDFSRPDVLEPLDVELPGEAEAVAVVDLDADGRADVLVGEIGRLYRVATLGDNIEGDNIEVGHTELLVESRGLNLKKLERDGFLEPGRLVVPGLRTLRIFEPGGDGLRDTGLRLAAEHNLPLRAKREPTGLRLYTYPVHQVRVDGRTLYIVGPEAHGNRRVRSLLIDPASGNTSESNTLEAWSWLPSPETIVDSWYTALNGRPALIVTTVKADHLGIFEKKKLRVFSLRTGDRSRSGSRASLKADTVIHQWQDADPNFVDVDGDGKVDLVLVQPEGLGGKKLVVEAYLGRSNAQFQALAWRSVAAARHPDTWRYGGDVDGDGIPDLVTRSGELVQVFRGIRNAKKKQLLEKKPAWMVDLSSSLVGREHRGGWERHSDSGRLDVRDLDGDGRAEILVPSVGEKSSRVRILTLSPP